MKTLVTGGAGFIGSHLTDRLLADGHEVTVLDSLVCGNRKNLSGAARNARFRLVEADLNDLDSVGSAIEAIDWVFHLAGLADIVPSIERPLQYHRANVDGTVALLEASRSAGVKRFLYTASSSCYGFPERVPTAETDAIRPQYPYALTKWLGECAALHWGQVYKLPVVSLRLFNVYGPRSRTSGTYGAVFGTFLAQKLAGKPFTVVGDGEQSRDFTYVSDVVEAFVRAADSAVSGEVFNVGSGRPQKVNRLVELLGGDTVHIPKRPGEPDCTSAAVGKIESALGWRAAVSFEEGVARLLENIDYWRDAPVWDPGSIAEATRDWFRYLGPEAGPPGGTKR